MLRTLARRSAGHWPGLYPRLLDADWAEVDASVRRHFASDAPVHAAGRFRVTGGRTWSGRLLARLCGLPRPGEDVAVSLEILPDRGGEVWRRSFDGRAFVTEQRADGAGRLLERSGPVEFRFRLRTAHGGIDFLQEAAVLRFGPASVALPAWTRPAVDASVRPAPGGRMRVSVRVDAPFVGPLVSYEGELERGEARP